MTISYNWLCEYLPDGLSIKPFPEQLSKILTSIGLEVESLTRYESVKGMLEGIVVGEVLTCEKHSNADKLKITTVSTGDGPPRQIVCGAANVAAGQKVVVALPGTTLYPASGGPLTIKAAKIRGAESLGMICAEDELGLGDSHEGILVLPASVAPGTPAAQWFKPYADWLFEIGLTPNHMDAMSHQGVARDVCAYLSHQYNRPYRVKMPVIPAFAVTAKSLAFTVSIENRKACGRYSGLAIRGIAVRESPAWIQDKLRAIGIRPINNVVDVTNYVLHETGQPLHAYDAAAITTAKIVVKNLPAGTPFVTLDGKERKLDGEDLMICNGDTPMCIAGVFGGATSGVKPETTSIFLESAWFEPAGIRRTSLRHGLRTDAAVHNEKGMDISGTVPALRRAAQLIRETAGGEIASDLIDVYPEPLPKTQVLLKFHYLKKLSGKNYHADAIRNILASLGFEILRQGPDDILIAVPYHKTDISLPADIVEEIMRIDGLDNIEIPATIGISPSVEREWLPAAYQEKISGALVGLGFREIFTNSITNSAYYSEQELAGAVRMINSLSAGLDVLRPSLLESGLETIAWNLNRKKANLRLFEFGKTYATTGTGQYVETNRLCLYLTGEQYPLSWKAKARPFDFYALKGFVQEILRLAGVKDAVSGPSSFSKFSSGLAMTSEAMPLAEAGIVSPAVLKRFDIPQPVFFADIHWDNLTTLAGRAQVVFRELPKQLPVNRDLALVVDKSMSYERVEKTVRQIGLNKLLRVQLFDIFESDRLGADRKSLAISFTFLDPEKTLTDSEIDGMMNRIMNTVETELQAGIRK